MVCDDGPANGTSGYRPPHHGPFIIRPGLQLEPATELVGLPPPVVDHEVPHCITQLAHVARPGMRHQLRHDPGRKPCRGVGSLEASCLARGLQLGPQEVQSQPRDIVPPAVERRQPNLVAGQPVQQRGLEPARGHQLVKRRIGGRHQPDIDPVRREEPRGKTSPVTSVPSITSLARLAPGSRQIAPPSTWRSVIGRRLSARSEVVQG